MPNFFSSVNDGIDVPTEKVAYLRWMAREFSNRTVEVFGDGDNIRVSLVESHGFTFNRYIRHETLSDHILYETVERIVGVPTVTPLVNSEFFKSLSREDSAALMKILGDVARRRNRVDQTRVALQSLNSMFSGGEDNPQLLDERRNMEKRQRRLDDTLLELEQFIAPAEDEKTTAKEVTISRARRSAMWTAEVNTFFAALMEQSDLPDADDNNGNKPGKPVNPVSGHDADDDDDDAQPAASSTTTAGE